VVNDVRAAAAVVEEITAGAATRWPARIRSAPRPEEKAIVEEAPGAFGSVDVLIDNAGIGRDRSLANLSAGELEAVPDVHLRGSFHVTKPAFR
jgi:NAD(P)-dependent dehydrogenase (short-subunit alcohol dehydrogenase family)